MQDSLEAIVPYEHQQEAENVPGIDLAANAIKMVLDVVELGHEVASANLARDAANYGSDNKLALAGTSKWSDPNSDPAKAIKDANEQIRRKTGRYANTLALGPDVATALKTHPKIKDNFKYTSSESITTDMLAKFFELDKVVIGKAVYLPEEAPEDALANDVWGDDAILAFVPNDTTGNFQVPSFGYQYELNGYPQVEQPYTERNIKSWVYPTTTERRAYLTGADAGFLFKAAV
ncbi:MAG: major capsid protein [Ahrensia sp.]|nr:major capsid protein [Ahrensia sp.]